jgi:ankyrin repeat protein
LDTIKVLIEWGRGQVNSVDQDGNTPLHWAVSTANCDVIRYLVYRGSNVESRNTNNETPLNLAAKNFDVVRKFDGLDSEIESWYNKLNDKGIRERVYLAIVMNLINDSFANTEVINLKGETPVTLIKKGLDNSTEYSDEQKKFILESIEPLSGLNKSDLNIEILFEVCKNANLIQIDYVLDNLIPPKIQDVDGYTHLHWLIEKFSYHRNRNKSKLFKYENVVEKYLNLIESSYLIDLCENKLKNSIFMHAVMHGNQKLVELIVRKCGCDILSQTNGIGYTALKLASVNAHDKVVSFLVEMGADVNAVGSDMNGDTPLTLAVIQGNCSTIEYLCNNGSDVDKPDKIGFTPVSLAIDNWAVKDKPEKIPDKNSRIYFWYEQMKHIGFTDCIMLAVGCYLVNDRKAKLEMDYLKLASQRNIEKLQRYSGPSKFEPLRNVTEMLKLKIDTERQLKNLNQTQIDFLHRFIICHNSSSEIVYRNLNKPRGFCLVVNNFDVDGKDKRFGSEYDVEKLKELFDKLEYQVEELLDKDGYELLDNFQEFSKRKEMKYHDSLVIFIMSHGGPETIYGRDGVTIDIREIIKIFNNQNCPYMRGKPIVIFIQACRGGESIDTQNNKNLRQ